MLGKNFARHCVQVAELWEIPDAEQERLDETHKRASSRKGRWLHRKAATLPTALRGPPQKAPPLPAATAFGICSTFFVPRPTLNF
jgi:hypothetical protein